MRGKIRGNAARIKIGVFRSEKGEEEVEDK